MKVVESYVGESIGDACRRIYFMALSEETTFITHFNDVSILFTPDKEGLEYGDDIDFVKITRIHGLSEKDLAKGEYKHV